MSDAVLVEQIRALEHLKSAAAAAQARITADLDASVRAGHADAGMPVARRGRGVGAQVAFARQESPYRGGQHLGLATTLTADMPYTLAALESGVLSEWRATLLVRETVCLTAEHRRWIDSELCADPDIMAQVSALLPVAQGVAVYAALRKAADSAIAAGDGRTRGQLMADTLVQRVTGQATATGVPVEIHLVMPEQTLLAGGSCTDRDSDSGSRNDPDGGGDQPAHLAGYGPIPADLARRLAVSAAEAEAAWLRRLYAAPDTGRLIAMDSTRRTFPTGLARFIEVRDQFCRTPWCDAEIRHIDHAVPHHEHGPTSEANGNGLCAQCNFARQAPGWAARPEPGPRHTVRVTTPTGHSQRSTAPPPPGHPRSKPRRPGRQPGRTRDTTRPAHPGRGPS